MAQIDKTIRKLRQKMMLSDNKLDSWKCIPLFALMASLVFLFSGLVVGCVGVSPKKNRDTLLAAPLQRVLKCPQEALKNVKPNFRVGTDSNDTLIINKISPIVILPDQPRAAFAIMEVSERTNYLLFETDGIFYESDKLGIPVPKLFYLNRKEKLVELSIDKKTFNSGFDSCVSPRYQFNVKKLDTDKQVLLIVLSVEDDNDYLGEINTNNPLLKHSEIHSHCLIGNKTLHANYFGSFNVKTSKVPLITK